MLNLENINFKFFLKDYYCYIYLGEFIKTKNQLIENFWFQDHWGAPSCTCTPPPTSKYYQWHIRRSNTSGAGEPGRAESGASSQALNGAHRRWRTTPKPSRSEGAVKEGEIRSARAREVGEGQGISLDNKGGVHRLDLEGGVGSGGEE